MSSVNCGRFKSRCSAGSTCPASKHFPLLEVEHLRGNCLCVYAILKLSQFSRVSRECAPASEMFSEVNRHVICTLTHHFYVTKKKLKCCQKCLCVLKWPFRTA